MILVTLIGKSLACLEASRKESSEAALGGEENHGCLEATVRERRRVVEAWRPQRGKKSRVVPGS